jgi:hypothetical protein
MDSVMTLMEKLLQEMSIALSLCLGFQQFPGDIAGDFQGFLHGSALGDQALNFVAGCQINSFRQAFKIGTA